MQRIVDGLEAYRRKHKYYPAHAVYDGSGTPILSWRVTLLPYLGHQELYEQFDLTQPWYAPHNKRLASQIPDIYQSPAYARPPATGPLS